MPILNAPLLAGEIEGEYEDSPKAIDPLAELRQQIQQYGQMTAQQISALKSRVERLERFLSSFNASNSSPVAGSERNTAIWDEWKAKLNSKPLSAIIDALLTHGELNADQINVITRCGRGNVSVYISRLNKVNLLNKNGNKFSLKQL